MELQLEQANSSGSSAGLITSSIDRREKLSYRDFLTKYEKPLRPVIITDALKDWKALSKWTPEFFRSRYPSKVVRFKRAEYRMDEFINMVLRSSEKEPVPYMRNVCISEEYPELFEDISPDPIYFLPNWLNAHFISKRLNDLLHRGAAHELYIGGSGMRFPVLHCDGYHTHAFICHIYGTKEFIAYSPDQTPFMYPLKGEETVCPIEDVEKPDLVKYPLFAKANPLRFRLEPGETLFIPSGWWHTAKTLSPAVSVSVNVANASNWTTLTKDLCHLSHNLLLAIPLAAYLTFFRLYKSVTD